MFVYLYITEPKDALSLPLIYSYSPLLYNTDFSSVWLEFTVLPPSLTEGDVCSCLRGRFFALIQRGLSDSFSEKRDMF